MYIFSKYFNPHNFVFADRFEKNALAVNGDSYAVEATAVGDDVYRIRIRNERLWPIDHSRAGLTPAEEPAGLKGRSTHLEIARDGSLSLKAGALGRTFLGSLAGGSFGVSGKAWMFQFRQRPDMQFYGMGEKSTPFEKSERSHRFWNTDVWADHGTSRVRDQNYDPDYISVPYVIIKRGNTYAGILMDNPHASVISISPRLNVANQMMAMSHDAPFFFLGAEDGPPALYILFGPSLAQLTMKLQRLAGASPLPPLWTLGHHQCRWGYRGAEDLTWLADNFEEHEFPNDGLWLDIDYMDGYRVFTYAKEHFTDPKADMESVQKRGFKVVPIIDPGVKKEKGYPVYDSGHEKDVFCRNPAGTEFTGVVWPGYTVFPDFSLERTQAWWADLVAKFAATGPDAAWLDMNDPSTGPVDPNDMLFQEGRAYHGAYHNQYASLMAEATKRGFLQARPNQRPFLLSRSGYTGGQKHSAHWTGDNYSNYHHLHMSIGKTINLALSGMPFNGGDVPGFGGNCKEGLFLDWYKAEFLFPFFRNHCMRTSRHQEPWVFPKESMQIARRYIRLRYKLLPYLYNLFIRNAETGDAVMRPLFYDFDDTRRLPLAHVNDQFLVGPWIMQAPFTVEGLTEREIILPAAVWWRADHPGWLEGPARLSARKHAANTPLFVREGAVLPMLQGIPRDNRKDLKNVELFLCLSRGFKGKAEYRYACDDGETFDYQRGMRSTYDIEAGVRRGTAYLRITPVAEGFGTVRFTPVTVEKFDGMRLEGPDGASASLRPEAFTSDIWGTTATFYAWR
ncbi:MAG: Alpha-glucosidase [Fibrobacteres bacterium]|nr:Alpha-glucosidase [Fibrobacterota bacterium]